MSLLDALKGVLSKDGGRVLQAPLVLREPDAKNKCVDTRVEGRGAHFALRLQGNDHLKFLRGAPGSADGYCNLPDYLVFSEGPTSKKSQEPVLHVMVVEMKSSRPESARRQIQLGVLVVPYLVALARLDTDLTLPVIHLCGVVLCPGLPPAKGTTRRGGFGYQPAIADRVGIHLYDVPCGEPLPIDEVDYCRADI